MNGDESSFMDINFSNDEHTDDKCDLWTRISIVRNLTESMTKTVYTANRRGKIDFLSLTWASKL